MKRGFLFNSIPAPKLRRTAFDLSRENTLALQMGKLVPFMCLECLPGDTFKISPKQLTRLMALSSPMMQRVDVKMEFFKVPCRLLHKDWEDFITGGESGTVTPSKPWCNLASVAQADYDLLSTGTLADYMGLPLPYERNQSTGAWSKIPDANWENDGPKIDLMPLNAYQKIFNDYYRDQNLQDEVDLCDESKQYGALDSELEGIFTLRNRAWKKDYFTAALTDPQRGNAVGIGLSGEADVTGTAGIENKNVKLGYFDGEDYSYVDGLTLGMTNPAGTIQVNEGSTPRGNAVLDFGDNLPVNGSADLSSASAIGITALRTAFKIQQFLERNNVAGARYIENILAHFGVKSSDARLQRAEFLRGYSAPVMISEVESNADSDGVPVGELAGKAKSVAGWKPFKTFCEEHCFIIGIISVIPTAKYAQGLSRMWTRFDKYDYFWNEFEHIGEQEIKNKELFFDFKSLNPDKFDEAFGYTARYAEYKYAPDEIHGDLRTSLSFWHQGRLFDNLPALNEDFIMCNPSDRVFAVQDAVSDQKVIADLWIDVKAVRPMSKYGAPRLT